MGAVSFDINGRGIDKVCTEVKKLILAGEKAEKDCFLQTARMLYNRTLHSLAEYSVDAGAFSCYYDMVREKYIDGNL